jgi:hypothetical protein
VAKRGRPRLSAATFVYPLASRLRRGDNLSQDDKAWIARWIVAAPALTRSWWICKPDGKLDRRFERWFDRAEAHAWRRTVEDRVRYELNR